MPDAGAAAVIVHIPARFVADTIAHAGDAGRAWIERLPAVIAGLCAEWGLKVEGEAMHGYLGVVFPALRGSERCVLKVWWVDAATEHEALRRLSAIVEVAALESRSARGWSLARVVDFRLWSLSMGFDKDAERCAVVAAALACRAE